MFKFLQLAAIVFILTLSGNMILSARGSAHEVGDEHGHSETSTENASPDTENWEFEAFKGASLSVMTRRALQLYDKTNETLNLSPAGIIFAETHIVQKLGGRLLEIGEKITIDHALVAEFAQKSTTLDEKQLKAWQIYADKANFNIDDIKPAKTPQSAGSAETESPAGSTNQNQLSDSEKKTGMTAKWQWWLVSLSALAILYYMARSNGAGTKDK